MNDPSRSDTASSGHDGFQAVEDLLSGPAKSYFKPLQPTSDVKGDPQARSVESPSVSEEVLQIVSKTGRMSLSAGTTMGKYNERERRIPTDQTKIDFAASGQLKREALGDVKKKLRGAPKWRDSIGSYQNEDLRSAEFISVEEADKAIDLFWDDPKLKGAPREIVNARTLILPEEVMQLLRRKRVVFEAKPLLTAEEISVEELTALRRKHGI